MQIDSPVDISEQAANATTVKLAGVSSSSGYVLGARLVRRQGVERVRQLMGQKPSLQEALVQLKKKVSTCTIEHVGP